MNLQEINDFLRGRRLKQFDPERFGRNARDQNEIIGIAAVFDHMQQFCTEVVYRIRRPCGEVFQYQMHYHANSLYNDGVVIAAYINGLLAVVKQWRDPLQLETHEIPREFPENSTARNRTDPRWAYDCLEREIGLRTCDTTRLAAHHMGNVASDPGISVMAVDYWHMDITAPDNVVDPLFEKPRADGSRLYRWGNKTVDDARGFKLRDPFSLTALALLDKAERRGEFK